MVQDPHPENKTRPLNDKIQHQPLVDIEAEANPHEHDAGDAPEDDPDAVHATVSFSHVDRLLSLEDNDGWGEVKVHLHHCQEVHGSHHTLDDYWVIEVVELPEARDHEEDDSYCLEELGP